VTVYTNTDYDLAESRLPLPCCRPALTIDAAAPPAAPPTTDTIPSPPALSPPTLPKSAGPVTISLGQTIAEVEAINGKPDRSSILGPRKSTFTRTENHLHGREGERRPVSGSSEVDCLGAPRDSNDCLPAVKLSPWSHSDTTFTFATSRSRRRSVLHGERIARHDRRTAPRDRRPGAGQRRPDYHLRLARPLRARAQHVVYPEGSGTRACVPRTCRDRGLALPPGPPREPACNTDQAALATEVCANRDRYLASLRARDAAGIMPDELAQSIRGFRKAA